MLEGPLRHAEASRSRQPGLAYLSVLGLLALMQLGPLMTYQPPPYTGEGNATRQLAFTLVFLFAVIGAKALHYPKRLLAIPLSLTLALLWCWLSLTWAIEPGIALRRLLLTTLIIYTVFIAVREIGIDATVRLIRLSMAATLVASYVAVFVSPSLGIHQVAESDDPMVVGCWRGILMQKNFAGAAFAFAVMYFVFYPRGLSTLYRFGMILGSAYFLYRTGSKTSMGLLVLGMTVGGIYAILEPRFRPFVVPVIVTLTAFGLIVSHEQVATFLDLFNRRDGLTGRMVIWPYLIDYWKDHPFGAGYGSFWNIGPFSPFMHYGKGWLLLLANGHNGYLDLLVQVGLPGLILVFAACILIPIWKVLSSRTMDPSLGGLLLACLIFAAGHNMTETSFFDRDAIVQTMLMFTIALVGLAGRAPRPSHRRPLYA